MPTLIQPLPFPTVLSYNPSFMTYPLITTNGGLTSYTFANGFKLILAPYPSAPRAHVQLVVRVGSKHEGYGETGMAHLLEHMLFKSTPTVPDIVVHLTDLSHHWNASTSPDRTEYHEEVDTHSVPAAVELEFQRLLSASFTEEQLRTEMSVVRNEMDLAHSRPMSVMFHTAQRLAFDWHGYGRTTLGAYSDVEGAPYSALRDFYRRHYRIDNAFLFVSGNFDSNALLQQVTTTFGAVERPSFPMATHNWTVEPAHAGPSVRTLRTPMNENHALLAWRAPPMFTEESVALEMALNAVANPAHRLLHQDCVEQSPALVNLQKYYYDQLDGGMAVLIASAKPEANVAAEIEPIVARIEHYKTQGIPTSALESARNEQLAQYHNVLVDWSQLHHAVVDAELHGDWQWAFVRHEWVKTVTTETMQAAFVKYLHRDNQTTVVLMPGEAQGFKGFKAPAVVSFPSVESIIPDADAPASSYLELHSDITQIVKTDLDHVCLLARKVSDSLVHVAFRVCPGNDASRAPLYLAHQYGPALREFGGNGKSQSEIETWFNAHNGFIHWQSTGFVFHVAPEAYDEAFALACGVYHAPEFTEQQFHVFRDNTVNALRQHQTDPVAQLRNWQSLQWDNLPDGHWGKKQSLQAKIDALLAWDYPSALDEMRRLSARGLVDLAICGDITPQQAENAYTNYAEPVADTEHQRPFVPAISTSGAVIPVYKVEMGDQPRAKVCGSLPLALHEDDPLGTPLTLAMVAFGGTSTARLVDRIREKEGLAYTVQAHIGWHPQAARGMVHMASTCAGETSDTTLALMQEEWARFTETGITEDELESARLHLRQYHEKVLGDDQQYMQHLIKGMLSPQDFEWHALQMAREDTCALADVNEAIRTALHGKEVQWALGRKADALATP